MNTHKAHPTTQRTSMRIIWRTVPLIVAAAAALVISACGSKSSTKGGGTVTILDVAGGIDKLDPGYWYYQADYVQIGQTTQRALYGWPGPATTPAPDLANGLPTVSDGGKTLTFHIKSGIKYSPPLQNRTVKAADISYALTRCLWPKTGNGYAGSYF